MKKLFVGRDFPSRFNEDNFKQRRSVGCLFDPESLISGAELAKGYTYRNSKRGWVNEPAYHSATEGNMTVEDILRFAPRVFVDSPSYARSDERTG